MSVDVDGVRAGRQDTDQHRASKRARLETTPPPPPNANRLSASAAGTNGATAPVPNFKLKYTVSAVKKSISCIAFSPDGRRMAVSSAEEAIHVHNTHNYALDRTLSSHTAGVSQVAFSADSTLLASASDDRTVRVWSVDPASDDDPAAPDVEGPGPHETSKRLLRGHLSAVFCVAWHPLGALLASGGMDETVRLWDIQSGKCTKVLPAHSDPVSAVGFNQDGSTIVTCSWDSHIRMWDTSTGQCLKTLVDDDNAPISFACFSPNSRYLFVSALGRDASVRLWDYQHDVVVKTFTGHVNRKYCIPMFATPDGKHVVTGSEDNQVYIWDLQTMRIVKRFESHKDAIVAIACHPTKRILATASLEKEPVIKIWYDNGLGSLE